MINNFETLPDNSRIWIYQSNRSLSKNEIESISSLVENFLEVWKSHGSILSSAYEIRYNRFIVIGNNQSFQNPTGCAIDSMVHFIQKLEKLYNENDFVDSFSRFGYSLSNDTKVDPSELTFENYIIK